MIIDGDVHISPHLGADRIGADYHLAHAETPVDPTMTAQIEALGAVQRARELFYLERWIDARREWYDATRDMTPEQRDRLRDRLNDRRSRPGGRR